MTAVLREIIVDCHDPKVVASFWAATFGSDVQEYGGGVLWISTPGTSSGAPLVVFVPSREPKSVRNRVRLAVGTDGRRLAEEVTRLIELGATPVDDPPADAGWRLLADPEGNEFCVLGSQDDTSTTESG